MKRNKGFTLIELLIVMSVIAILSVIGMGAYSVVYKSSRDGKRKSDIKFIQSALEDYHADQINYPTSLGATLVAAGRTYMNQVPTDPMTSPNYNYVALPVSCDNSAASPCTSYCIYAKMELPLPVDPPPIDPLCVNNVPSGGYNYGITKP